MLALYYLEISDRVADSDWVRKVDPTSRHNDKWLPVWSVLGPWSFGMTAHNINAEQQRHAKPHYEFMRGDMPESWRDELPDDHEFMRNLWSRRHIHERDSPYPQPFRTTPGVSIVEDI